MVNKKDRTEDYLSLEKKKKLARKQFLVLSIVLFPGLFALIGYSLFYTEVNYYIGWISWIIGMSEQSFTFFLLGFLALFDSLIGIPFTIY